MSSQDRDIVQWDPVVGRQRALHILQEINAAATLFLDGNQTLDEALMAIMHQIDDMFDAPPERRIEQVAANALLDQ